VKHILFHTQSLSGFGANRSMLGLARELKRRGYQVSVVAPRGAGMLRELVLLEGLPFLQFPTPWTCSPTHPSLKQWVKRQLSRVQFLLMAPLLAALYKALKADLIVSNSSVISQGALACLLTGKAHFWYFREFVDLDLKLQFDLPFWFQKFLWKQARERITITKAVALHFEKNFRAPVCRQIYNGIFTEKEIREIEQKLPLRDLRAGAPLSLGILGRFTETKGQHIAIEALALLRAQGISATLQLFGEGESHYEERCRQLAATLDVPVRFHGVTDKPLEALEMLDVLLVPSRAEAMGRVTLEGMAAGKSVIATGSGGTLELIEDRKNGLLFDGTAEDLARKIRELSLNPQLHTELARNGREFVRGFSFELCADAFVALLRKSESKSMVA
jgi:glycosyltransferase involved in cell wall biosynthesis